MRKSRKRLFSFIAALGLILSIPLTANANSARYFKEGSYNGYYYVCNGISSLRAVSGSFGYDGQSKITIGCKAYGRENPNINYVEVYRGSQVGSGYVSLSTTETFNRYHYANFEYVVGTKILHTGTAVTYNIKY